MDFNKSITLVGLKLNERLGKDFSPVVEDSIRILEGSRYQSATLSMLQELYDIEDDFVTFEHSLEVALLCMFFKPDMELKYDTFIDEEILLVGSLIHDIGKVQVPLSVLNKPGRLTDSEFDEMKNHVTYGVSIAEEYGITDPEILDMVEYHHEKDSGGGYKGIYITDLDHSVWLINFADQLSALTQDRPYKAAKPLPAAIEIMGSNGVSSELLSMIS